MARKTMMREMNMRYLVAHDRSMFILPCLIMPKNSKRSGGSLMKER